MSKKPSLSGKKQLKGARINFVSLPRLLGVQLKVLWQSDQKESAIRDLNKEI